MLERNYKFYDISYNFSKLSIYNLLKYLYFIIFLVSSYLTNKTYLYSLIN